MTGRGSDPRKDAAPPATAPAAQAAPPAPEEQPLRHQVHHSYIWLGSLRTASAMMAVFIFSSLSGIVGSLSGQGKAQVFDAPHVLLFFGLAVAGIVVVGGLILLYQVISFRNLYYELGADEFNLYSGILNKKRVHVPYQRIQSVDQRATLVQRVFGVCSVHIDTAGGASNKAVLVPYLQKMQAEELRRELFARKQRALSARRTPEAAPGGSGVGASAPVHGNVLDAPAEIWQDVHGVFGGQSVDTGRVSFEYGLSNRELVLTGLTNSTAFFVVALGIVGFVAQLAGQVVPILFSSLEPAFDGVVSGSVQLFGGNVIAAGVAVFLVAAALLWAASAIGSCITFGGFRARRRDGRIEVEHGLLQHRFQGVDIDRVQSVVVKQSFVRRLFGYCELSLGKVDAAAQESQDRQKGLNRQGLIIHPFVKLKRVPEILAGVAPEFAGIPAVGVPVAPVALRRALIRRCIVQGTGFWLAVLVGSAQFAIHLAAGASEGEVMLPYVDAGAAVGYALCAALLVLDAAGALLWFRGSSFAYNERFMQVSNGGFSRETVSFPRKKIQFGYSKTNPFQRLAGTATLNVRTAAGVGGTTVKLIDAREDDASAWLRWLKPRGNVIQ